MSGPLGVSHLMIFNQTDAGVNLRIARCPRGPTCTFRVNKFALNNDILRSQKRPRAPGTEFNTQPLLVLNNFGGEARHLKLLVTVFQNLFPPIQVQSMHLSQARRVVLLSYNAETETIDWRHYLVSVRPVGVSRSVRRVIEGTTKPGSSNTNANAAALNPKRKGKGLPNLGNVGDISEYVLGRSHRAGSAGAASDTDMSEAESEVEDMNDPNNAVELFQKYVGRGNDANEQRAVRLREIGPRMELKLIKIEEGLASGETLYHDRVQKSAREAAVLKQSTTAKAKLKEARKAEQEANVARKKEEKEARKQKPPATIEDIAQSAADGSDSEEAEEEIAAGEDDEDEDEFEYEDRFGPGAGGDNELFEDEDDLGADDDEISLSDGEGHIDDEEYDDGEATEGEEDETPSEKSFDEGNDDSDLDPIPLDGGLQAYSDSEDEEQAPTLVAPSGSSKRRKLPETNFRGKAASSRGKGKGRGGRR